VLMHDMHATELLLKVMRCRSSCEVGGSLNAPESGSASGVSSKSTVDRPDSARAFKAAAAAARRPGAEEEEGCQHCCEYPA
jgi:hypothetical protein